MKTLHNKNITLLVVSVLITLLLVIGIRVDTAYAQSSFDCSSIVGISSSECELSLLYSKVRMELIGTTIQLANQDDPSNWYGIEAGGGHVRTLNLVNQQFKMGKYHLS